MPSSSIVTAIATTVALLLSASTAHAQEGQLPPIVTKGMAVFQSQGVEAGVRALTPNWSNPEDQDKQQQLVDAFKRIEPSTGALAGYDLVRLLEISPHYARAYIIMLFENMPTFLVLTLYTAPGKEALVTSFTFNTEASKAFPPVLLEPQAVMPRK